MRIGVVLGSIFLVALAGVAAWGAFVSWGFGGRVEISIHGYIAMAIGGLGSLLLAGGLIWLAYYSARKGFDQPHDEL